MKNINQIWALRAAVFALLAAIVSFALQAQADSTYYPVANAGTLAGSTLNATVTGSSLTGVGTLTSGGTGAGFTIDFGASTLSNNVPLNHGGTGQATAAASRGSSGLNIDQETTHGDSIYTILSTDRTVATSAAFTAARIWTLPAANSINAGQYLCVVDQAGGVTASNTLTISRAGSDTVDAGTSYVLNAAYQGICLLSDGTSKWSSRRIPGAAMPAFSGDVASSLGGTVLTIQPGSVTNADLAGSIATSKLASVSGTGSTVGTTSGSLINGHAAVFDANGNIVDGGGSPGAGTVTTTGSPASGNIVAFSGATSVTNSNLSGDVTTSGTLATTIAANAVTTTKINNAAVTLAKIANAAASSKLVGSGASGSGSAYSEITLGTGLSMSGTTLNNTATGGACDTQTFTSTGANTWTKPSCGTMAFVQVWGAGGSGGSSILTTTRGGGGAGGSYTPAFIPVAILGATETATVGAGGAAVNTNVNGNVGGNSTFGAWVTGYGGGGGGNGTNETGGGGAASGVASNNGQVGNTAGASAGAGGSSTPALSANTMMAGGAGGAPPADGFYGGAGGGSAAAAGTVGGQSVYGGGGGAGASTTTTNAGVAGGVSQYGGGGGGGATGTGSIGPRSVSLFGGYGGKGGNNSTAGEAGGQPGGGGGGGGNSLNSGKGGDGKIVVMVF